MSAIGLSWADAERGQQEVIRPPPEQTAPSYVPAHCRLWIRLGAVERTERQRRQQEADADESSQRRVKRSCKGRRQAQHGGCPGRTPVTYEEFGLF